MSRVEELRKRLRRVEEAREGTRQAGQLASYASDLDRLETSYRSQLEEAQRAEEHSEFREWAKGYVGSDEDKLRGMLIEAGFTERSPSLLPQTASRSR